MTDPILPDRTDLDAVGEPLAPVEPVDHATFEAKVAPPPSGRTARLAMVLGAAALLTIGTVAAMAANAPRSTDPLTAAAGASAGADASGAPDGSTAPGGPGDGGRGGPLGRGSMGGLPFFGFGGRDGGRGGIGLGGVRITAIDGSSLSLATDDGWTRTITLTSDAAITRAGKTITVGDLKIGDRIGFRESKQSDGSYKITAVSVVLPSVIGQVQKVDGDTITVTTFGGTTATIHVSGSTTYSVAGKATAALSDVAVGDVLVATGTQRSDGSLDAESVRAGGKFGGGQGRPWGGNGNGGGHGAAPAPSASPSGTTS